MFGGPEPPPPGPDDPKCAAAATEMKTVCGDGFADIAAALAAGTITEVCTSDNVMYQSTSSNTKAMTFQA
jgi:hypothetical protein